MKKFLQTQSQVAEVKIKRAVFLLALSMSAFAADESSRAQRILDSINDSESDAVLIAVQWAELVEAGVRMLHTANPDETLAWLRESGRRDN